MNRINLALVFHMHQPVGNYPEVLEDAVKKAYLPLLTSLFEREDMSFGLHVSGPLWEYFEEHYPEIIDMVAKMSARGTLETIGGGFYEPILCGVPRRDAFEQLVWLGDFLEDRFLERPKGVWLPERIWEPDLPSLLTEAGYNYTFVDDYHLKAVGIRDERLFGHFLTENEGNILNLVPISERLRYLIPFAEPEETIEYLRKNATLGDNRLFVFGDDAEKFGHWPHTYDWVWNRGWFSRFLDALSRESEWIRLLTPSQAVELLPPSGRIYLPAGSYFELNEWTLPADLSVQFSRFVQSLKDTGRFEELECFIKGGFWRNFLVKYEESNWMHKRMHYISRRLQREIDRLPEERQEEAERALYAGQCNCAYWHGVYGGLYLPHLRRGIWENLLACENMLGVPEQMPVIADIDSDGRREVNLNNGKISLWIKPEQGGMIAEVGLPFMSLNLTDTLSRRPEGYHEKLFRGLDDVVGGTTGASNVESFGSRMQYDKRVKRFAHDHLFPPDATLEGFMNGSLKEMGGFVDHAYKLTDSNPLGITMQREGLLKCANAAESPRVVFIQKEIQIDETRPRFMVRYTIENRGGRCAFLFGVETNLSLLSNNIQGQSFVFPDESLLSPKPGTLHNLMRVNGYEYRDAQTGIRLLSRFDPCGLWMLPLYTFSQSMSGLEKILQGTTVMHLWPVEIDMGGTFTTELYWWATNQEDEKQAQSALFEWL